MLRSVGTRVVQLPLVTRLHQLVRLLFEDKRYTMLVLVTWLLFSCAIFHSLGAFHISFMSVGPSETCLFMGMPINTWGKWSCLAVFSFVNTTVNEFLSTALAPWLQNTIQDHKCVYLPYSKTVCVGISLAFTFYEHVMGMFGIFLFFSQVDFLFIRCVADLMVSTGTTYWFMANKTVDRVMYTNVVQYGRDTQPLRQSVRDTHHNRQPGQDDTTATNVSETSSTEMIVHPAPLHHSKGDTLDALDPLDSLDPEELIIYDEKSPLHSHTSSSNEKLPQ
jgi:hypothetical protein